MNSQSHSKKAAQPQFGQVGTLELPVVVISAGSKYDRYKSHQSFLVADYGLEANEFLTSSEMQWDHAAMPLTTANNVSPSVQVFCSCILPDREGVERKVYKIKVSKNVVVETSTGEPMSVTDLRIGSKCVIVVRAEPWVSKKQFGYVFRCVNRLMYLGQSEDVSRGGEPSDDSNEQKMQAHVWY